MALSFTTQPVDTQVTFESITGALTVVAAGAETLTYQWYEAVSKTSVVGATLIAGATTDSFTIPTDLVTGDHFYFCRVSASEENAVDSYIATVQVVGSLPEVPKYVTGAWCHDFIEDCSQEVQERFTDLQAQTGITIGNNSNTLRSAQIELFMSAI